MQCLYCRKRLGLFASKKRPFCSEVHEVAYQDEQSGIALRRVLDPLFTEPIAKAPLQVPLRGATESGLREEPPQRDRSFNPTFQRVGPEVPQIPAPLQRAAPPIDVPSPLEHLPPPIRPDFSAFAAEFAAEEEEEPLAFRPAIAPAPLASFVREARVQAATSEPAPVDIPLEFAITGSIQLPRKASGLLGVDFEEAVEEIAGSEEVIPERTLARDAEQIEDPPFACLVDEARFEATPSDLAPLEVPVELALTGAVELPQNASDSPRAENTAVPPFAWLVDEPRFEARAADVPLTGVPVELALTRAVQLPQNGSDLAGAENTAAPPYAWLVSEPRFEARAVDVPPTEVPVELALAGEVQLPQNASGLPGPELLDAPPVACRVGVARFEPALSELAPAEMPPEPGFNGAIQFPQNATGLSARQPPPLTSLLGEAFFESIASDLAPESRPVEMELSRALQLPRDAVGLLDIAFEPELDPEPMATRLHPALVQEQPLPLEDERGLVVVAPENGLTPAPFELSVSLGAPADNGLRIASGLPPEAIVEREPAPLAGRLRVPALHPNAAEGARYLAPTRLDLESDLDPRQLRCRHPVASIAVARGRLDLSEIKFKDWTATAAQDSTAGCDLALRGGPAQAEALPAMIAAASFQLGFAQAAMDMIASVPVSEPAAPEDCIAVDPLLAIPVPAPALLTSAIDLGWSDVVSWMTAPGPVRQSVKGHQPRAVSVPLLRPSAGTPLLSGSAPMPVAAQLEPAAATPEIERVALLIDPQELDFGIRGPEAPVSSASPAMQAGTAARLGTGFLSAMAPQAVPAIWYEPVSIQVQTELPRPDRVRPRLDLGYTATSVAPRIVGSTVRRLRPKGARELSVRALVPNASAIRSFAMGPAKASVAMKAVAPACERVECQGALLREFTASIPAPVETALTHALGYAPRHAIEPRAKDQSREDVVPVDARDLAFATLTPEFSAGSIENRVQAAAFAPAGWFEARRMRRVAFGLAPGLEEIAIKLNVPPFASRWCVAGVFTGPGSAIGWNARVHAPVVSFTKIWTDAGAAAVELLAPVWSGGVRRGMLRGSNWRRPSWKAVHPETGKFAQDGFQQTAVRIQPPALPAWPELNVPSGMLAGFSLEIHVDRRRRFRPGDQAAASTGLQRFRAASHIQIREPVLVSLHANDLPVPVARLPWRSVRVPAAGAGISSTPVPLRPPVQPPGLA